MVGCSSPDKLALFRSGVIESVQNTGMIEIDADDGTTLCSRSSASCMFQRIALSNYSISYYIFNDMGLD